MSRIVVMLAALLGAGVISAEAATFSVNPTQIFLTGKNASALLTLRNDSNEPLRFQLSAFAWQQGSKGEIELEPTTDVVFFPALLTLQPGEERKVRVGGIAAAGAREKTYRIFVEELPAVDAALPGASVKVLTKMGIPIFVRPAAEKVSASLQELAVSPGRVQFAVLNEGSVHVVPEGMKVRLMDAAGQEIEVRDVAGWYVLAGGRREFEVETAAGSCARVAAVAVEAQLDGKQVTRTIQAPAGVCAG